MHSKLLDLAINKNFDDHIYNCDIHGLDNIKTYYDSKSQSKMRVYSDRIYSVMGGIYHHGNYRTFYKNGIISSDQNFYYGIQILNKRYYISGKIEYSQFYDLDKEVSYSESYYKSGILKSKNEWFVSFDEYFNHLCEDDNYKQNTEFNFDFADISSKYISYTYKGNIKSETIWFNNEHRIVIDYVNQSVSNIKYECDYYSNYVTIDYVKNDVEIYRNNTRQFVDLQDCYIDDNYQIFYQKNKHLFIGAK